METPITPSPTPTPPVTPPPAPAPFITPPPPPPPPPPAPVAPPVIIIPKTPPPPPPPPIMPTTPAMSPHTHTGSWITLAVVMLLVGLIAGAAGGYYLGLNQSSSLLQESAVTTPATPTDTTGVQSTTDASSSNPLNGVKLNPFE